MENPKPKSTLRRLAFVVFEQSARRIVANNFAQWHYIWKTGSSSGDLANRHTDVWSRPRGLAETAKAFQIPQLFPTGGGI
jgi:hypothetical protein